MSDALRRPVRDAGERGVFAFRGIKCEWDRTKGSASGTTPANGKKTKMARAATIKRATAREAVKNGLRDGALSRLRTDPERNYTTVIVGVLCALVAGYGTYRFLNDDYELSFERNLRHMSQNVVACVQTKRIVNTNGPIPVCFDPVSGRAVTVDVATLPPAAVPPAVSKDAANDAPKKASDVKPVSVQKKPVVSPLIFHHPSRKLFDVPGHDAPMTLFKPR